MLGSGSLVQKSGTYKISEWMIVYGHQGHGTSFVSR